MSSKLISEQEKRLKNSLVKVRKTIASKFKKLHCDRIERERELAKKYAPITDTIKKLIDTKRNIQNERNRIDDNEDDNERNDEAPPPQPFSYDGDDNEEPLEGSDVEINNNNGNDHEIVDMSYEIADVADANVVPQRRRIERRRRIDHDEIVSFLSQNPQPIESGKRERDREVMRHDFYDDEIAHHARKSIKKRRFLDADEIARHKRRKSIKRKRLLDADDEIANENGRESIKRKRLLTVAAMAKQQPFDLKAALRNVQRTRKVTASMLRKKIVNPEGNLLLQARKGRFEFTDGITKDLLRKKMKKIKLRGSGVSLLEEKFIPYTQNIAYEYYDDPNELVDRLRLLVASKSVGNSNHAQEINSILEELRERKLIE